VVNAEASPGQWDLDPRRLVAASIRLSLLKFHTIGAFSGTELEPAPQREQRCLRCHGAFGGLRLVNDLSIARGFGA